MFQKKKPTFFFFFCETDAKLSNKIYSKKTTFLFWKLIY